MNRRQYIAALGTVLAGGTTAIGTGAFTNASAQRDVTVTVADDSAAYLAIEPTTGPNQDYTVTSGDGTLGLDFSGNNPNGPTGTGVNTDAVTDIEDIFQVRNQGTQPLWFWIRITDGGFKTEYYLSDSDDETPLSLPKTAEQLSGKNIQAVYLKTGVSVNIGVSIDSFGNFGKKHNTLSLHAVTDQAEVPDNISAESPN